MGTLLQDLRYGARMLVKQKTFTGVAILTLALGIGANSAIFSVINAVLFRPLQLKEPDQLVRIYEILPQGGFGSVSYPNYKDWSEQSDSFTGIAAYQFFDFSVEGPDHPERINSVTVSPNFFDVLEQPVALGRAFREGDDRLGNHRVVVLSHQTWQRNFAGDTAIVNSDIQLNGESYTVIGIMPPGVIFPAISSSRAVALWVPLVLSDNQKANRGSHFLSTFARLKPGVTLDEAQRQMTDLGSRIERDYPQQQTGRNVQVNSLREEVVARVRPTLWILWGAVGFVLLIGCTNVANLLLARATGRRREIAIRTALGASRWRLTRQFLTESVMLAVMGGLLGLLLAKWGLDGIIALAANFLPRANEIAIDWTVAGFTLLLSVLTGIAFGLAPAVQVSRTNLQEALKDGSSSGTSPHRNWLRSVLVVTEVAAALVLLVGAGLLIKSFVKLQQVESGVDAENVVTMRITLPGARYETFESLASFHDQLLGRVSNMPDVRAAGIINLLPLQQSGTNGGIVVEGQPPPLPGQEILVEYRGASAGYFNALGIPLLSGRSFNDQDREGNTPVVIINKALADKFFPGENPIGRRIQIFGPVMRTVVGVVGDVRQWRLNQSVSPEIFGPYTQQGMWPRSVTLVARSTSDPARLGEAIRQEVLAVDPNQPVHNVLTMATVVSNSFADSRLNMTLLSLLAGLAIVLASIGIYSVMSYTVMQNTREIGIRMALGAQARHVLKLVLGQGLVLTLIGIFLGVVGAFGLTRLMESLLYGVAATDPLTFAAVSALFVAVALLACYVPARRATKVDPMVALRYE